MDEIARDEEGRYTGSRGALKQLWANHVENIQECRAARTKLIDAKEDAESKIGERLVFCPTGHKNGTWLDALDSDTRELYRRIDSRVQLWS